jgi:AcrR family transcriptional regulator
MRQYDLSNGSCCVEEVSVPRLTAEREEARRQAILVAAREVFVEKGFHRATTHDVARTAGVPIGSIYTYFASKEELIWASILAANKAETDAIVRDVRAGGSTRERVARALAGWYAYTIDAPGVAQFLAEIWAEATRRPLIRDLVARRRERMVTVAALILAEIHR